jgi:hemerythrin
MADWISWSPEWRVGVEIIDHQHEELFRKFNELGDALWDGQGKDRIGEMLGFIANYAVGHFADEEAFMLERGYEGYADHKHIHDAFVEEVTATLKRYEMGENSSQFVIRILNRLGEWTRDHVRGHDQKITGVGDHANPAAT